MTTATRAPRPRAASERRLRFQVYGVVQGVGFRPFVHRLAGELGVTGFVGNDSGAVFVEVQGPAAALDEFQQRVIADAPPLARITRVAVAEIPVIRESDFTVTASEMAPGAITLVSPDVATCASCRHELFDPADRRYRHPFITCTDCGPRYTIIRDLPYDRPNTTMAPFGMCDRCADEYADVTDRRFHAQPIACPDCGPALSFSIGGEHITGTDAAIAAAQRALRAGRIVAVKGVGGYHLACRADDSAAIGTLRERKSRDHKPFALLVRDLATARRLAHVTPDEERFLTSAARPIVLLRRRTGAPVDPMVAPDNPLLGVLLPYSPVHHLLLNPVPGAQREAPDVLVFTSANISDEPLCFDDIDAAQRLPRLADAVLDHDRPIHVPCDDSVVRVVAGRELPIRRSRGYAPLPVALHEALPPTLAVGGELKNTACIIDGTNAFCSAHVGDMGSPDTTRAFERTIEQLTTSHRLAPRVLVADAHPGYLTRAWAERHAGGRGEPALHFVQHHHAHVVSLLAEHGLVGHPILGIAFDGTGYGDDATVWGGEFLLLDTDPSRYERVGHLRTVALPGGDTAVRNPCRTALAYLAASDVEWRADLPPVAACERGELAAVRSQLARNAGTVPCSSMGRLFDAVAALLGVRQRIHYEGQAAIELEMLAVEGSSAERTAAGGKPDGALPLPVDTDGVLDYGPLIRAIVTQRDSGVDAAALAYRFHVAVAESVAEFAARTAPRMPVPLVGLTGGVFQNVLLLAECTKRLAERRLDVITHETVPPNDGGLALGQAVVGALQQHARDAGAEFIDS